MGALGNNLVLVLLFVAVVLLVMGVGALLRPKVDLSRRLRTTVDMPDVPIQQTLRSDHGASPWAKLIEKIESHGLSLNDDKAPILQQKLTLAGYDQPHAVRAFVLARTVLTLVCPIVAYTIITLNGMQMSMTKLYFYVVGAAALGLYTPNIIISSRADTRKQEILNGFPDSLDLMLVCVEAGLGIDACFARVGSEMVSLHPRLAELFAGVSLELRAGRPRSEALKNMARKSGVPEIQSFATLVVQSDKLGASIGQALKIYAAEMRESRRMRAEEKAHRLPVLLSVPLVLFLLPVMVGVLALPAVISISSLDIGG